MSHAKALTEQLNEFHAFNNVYDDDLDVFIYESYAKTIRKGKSVNWSIPYFSPSSANMCERAQWHKAKKHRRDSRSWQPHQRRWVEFGEAIAGVHQREFMLSDRHFEKFTGRKPRYSMGMTDEGLPFMEEHVFRQKMIEHNGEKFSLIGTLDAVLIDNETGKPLIVELKSKQQTPSKTSLSAMKEAQPDHIKQVIAYSLMYGIDDAVIMYQNVAHKAWDMTEEDFKKTPDIRLFDVDISEEAKNDILDGFADTMRRVREDDPPLPNLLKWRFNDYKDVISETLTDEEVSNLEMVADFLKGSRDTQPWMKPQIDLALNDIKRRREAVKNA